MSVRQGRGVRRWAWAGGVSAVALAFSGWYVAAFGLETFLQQLLNGLQRGSIYALIALGFTMVYGIIQLINFAHGDIFMFGAYIAAFVGGAWLAEGRWGALVVALIVSMVVTELLDV